ncbi:hypothetical protein DID80_00705 [Candidatus Marinamargulisbacteria bacterium SCGC AAA071-K20]|nr:hypothetical protein DID80_00705 [Candidatus Marinamargulisbacteria bacterium SCGC AAA071-K20]
MKRLYIALIIMLFATNSLYSWEDFQEIQDPGVRTTLDGLHAYIVHYQNWLFYTINTHTPGYIETGVYNTRTVEGNTEIRPFFRWRAGPVIETGRDLDFYLDAASRGFFAVQMPTSLAYTRDGRFILDSQRRMVTMSGNYPLLGENGHIYLPEGESISVSRAGLIYVDGEPIDRMKIVVFKRKSDMTYDNIESLNGSFFVLTREIETISGPQYYLIKQGMLEENNVLKAITGDIGMAKNSYDATVKTAHMINKALGTAASIANP